MDISVIIPTYNRLWSLPETIESCRNTKCRVEIIVVDDGSTDGTQAWLELQKDLIILQQSNLGKCWAVNKAFAIAGGKYIRFLDSDDKVADDANDGEFELAEKTQADVVVSGHRSFKNDGTIVSSREWIETDDFIAQQLGECDSSHYSAYLFKKDFIADIPHRPDFAFRDDRLFVLEVALKEPAVAIYQEPALLHRVTHTDRLQESSGLKTQVQNFQHLNLYKYIIKQLQQSGKLTTRRINAALNKLWPLYRWIAKNNLTDAKAVLAWLYELKPDFVIPEKGYLGVMYRNLGSNGTEKLLQARRFLKYGWK